MFSQQFLYNQTAARFRCAKANSPKYLSSHIKSDSFYGNVDSFLTLAKIRGIDLIFQNMYSYIKGELTELAPTTATIENNGIGYELQISLQTFTGIQGLREVMLYIHHHIREDVELWYGFATKEERNIFRMLIEVNGIGPNTARMMLSSLSCQELKSAIMSGDVNRIKSVKGIGLKTAQRVIIDLKDKIAKGGDDLSSAIFAQENSSATLEEALSALVMLGFAKAAADKALKAVYKEKPESTLEELIKFSLKRL